jgi:hypothetical protein
LWPGWLPTSWRGCAETRPTRTPPDGRARRWGAGPAGFDQSGLIEPWPAVLNPHENQTWNISSPSPNLRITGTFAGEVKPDVIGFGSLLEVLTSFVSVAELRGRYILRDGYHRTYRMIAAGLVRVPAFVRHFGENESVFRSGMLPEVVYCGDRPPTLGDYHDDAVAGDVSYSPTDTMISVQAAPAHLAFGRLV